MNTILINILQIIIYLIAIMFIINIIKTRVYIYLILNFFVYIIFISFTFYFLQFEIIAFLLILVYAGAVVILFTFVVMLYENHKLVFISSSYMVLLFLYVLTSVLTFFLLNGNKIFTKKETFLNNIEQILRDEVFSNYLDFLLAYDEGVKRTSMGKFTDFQMGRDLFGYFYYVPMRDRYQFERYLLSDDATNLGPVTTNYDSVLHFYTSVEHLLGYYNYIDSYIFKQTRIPHHISIVDNFLYDNFLEDVKLHPINFFFYSNKPYKVVDPVTDNVFVIDNSFFDLLQLFTPFEFEKNLYWNLDMYSLLMYTEHWIKPIGSDDYVNFTALPPFYNIKYDLIFYTKPEQHEFFMKHFQELNEFVGEMYGIDINSYKTGHLVSLNSLFKVFDEISLFHNYNTILNDFFYVNFKGDYLFNVIGLYVYTNCIFEFMILGLMLFICLICIMRLLKKGNE